MSTRFAIFFLIITGILSLSAYYIGHRTINRFPWAASHRSIIWLVLSVIVLLQILGPILYRQFPEQFLKFSFFSWLSYTALGVFVSTFLYVVAADIVVGIWNKLIGSGSAVDLERRSFLAAGAFVLGSSMIGVAQAVSKPKLYTVEIPIEGLPEAFDGFKIVQITDLHLGPTIGREYTETVVKMTNELEPDLVALTGDFVDGSVDQLRNAIEPIADIHSKHGSYFVTGNHEYYWGVDEWLAELKQLGVEVLLNEHRIIRKNGNEILLAGVTDYSAGRMLPAHQSDPHKAISGAPAHLKKILLAHQPANYKEGSKAGFDLQLSGHTHGGQFFPWSLFVAMSHRYYKGLSLHDKMWIYVSRGTGYWGPPIRFGVPSEITLVKLKRTDHLPVSQTA